MMMALAAIVAVVLALVALAAFALPPARRVAALLRTSTDQVGGIAASQIVLQQSARGEPQLTFAGSFPADPAWDQIGGDGKGWPADTFYKVRSLKTFGGKLYASLTGPRSNGDRGEVWAWSKDTWTCVAGNGENGSWSGPAFVDQLAEHDGALFAGTTRLWKYDGQDWADVSGPLPTHDNSGVYAFASLGRDLALSFWGDPGVALFDGEIVRRLPAPANGWGAGVKTVYSLAVFNGVLYAGTGTGSFRGPGAAIFRYDGQQWEKVAGSGLRGSWTQDGIPFLLSLRVFNRHLVATLSRPHDTPASASNVWAFDGDEWQPIATARVPDAMTRSLVMNDSAVHRGSLVVATGDGNHHDARVWALTEGQRWRDLSGQIIGQASSGTGGTWIYSLCSDGDLLFAGTAGHQGGARVFRMAAGAADGGE